ncbi:hypothetical protein [Paraburkholderia terrae]|uniref:hypothetical protein n=1 Tax=Paraburkholderia terrae TaxID=311230 RepID=UPI002070E895|nr:hypothetical protein [Paraburkholderia terrae]BDC46107.1 hypothetical protein PTKU15_94040 [Paraburkholderia terrae]
MTSALTDYFEALERLKTGVPRVVPQGDMTSRVNMIGSVFSMFEFPEGDVAVNLDGGSS